MLCDMMMGCADGSNLVHGCADELGCADEWNVGCADECFASKMETNVHAPQGKPASVPKRYSWAYSWTWRHNVALLESVAAALPKALGHWSFEKRKKWMGGCLPGMIENHECFLKTLEEQNRFTAQAKRKFWHLSHTPANRNECPYCKHFLTSPTDTSILSLGLKNHNFKFITLTRAASQPVALFMCA